MNTAKPLRNRAETLKYLQKHRVKELLHFLMTDVIIHQPEDPLLFLVDLLDACMMARLQIREPPKLFEEEHIRQVFKSFDPANTGLISKVNFKTAMASLGIVNPSNPFSEKEEKITMEVFENEAKKSLDNYIRTIICAK